MITFGTEQGNGFRLVDGEGLGLGRCDDDRAADGVNTGVDDAGNNHLASHLIERAEVVLGGCIRVITLPVNGVDAQTIRSQCCILGILVGDAFRIP